MRRGETVLHYAQRNLQVISHLLVSHGKDNSGEVECRGYTIERLIYNIIIFLVICIQLDIEFLIFSWSYTPLPPNASKPPDKRP
jgi:hypothetical protein